MGREAHAAFSNLEGMSSTVVGCALFTSPYDVMYHTPVTGQ